MIAYQRRLVLSPIVILLFAWLAPATLRADLIELVNGDHYSGVVISLDRTNLAFQSEIQGLVKIPREKVAKITLRESTPKASTNKLSAASGEQTPPASSTAAIGSGGQTSSVIQQLRQQGVDPGMMNKIQEQVLGGQSSPEATRMFNEMVAGLMGGSLNVEDIRTQARKAIKDIESAKKDLGNDPGTSGVLDGYLAILQKFVNETDTPSPGGSPTKPASSSGAPVK